jgi:hypothetical protein
MAQHGEKPAPVQSKPKPKPTDALSDAALDQVTGGTGVMKSKHDTVKNSISNVR